MSATFTKVFSSILESTIWIEPYPTRIVWFAMLAMADHKGRVWASVPGLAKRAGVTRDECEAALVCFLSPDPDSRTKDFDGRRIETIDGGWQLVNYLKYREMRDDEHRREYQREWDRTRRNRPTKSDKSDKIRPDPTNYPTKAEVDVEVEKEKTTTLSRLARDASPLGKQTRYREEAESILTFLNARTDRAYQPVAANIEMIVARLREGATAGQCRQVIVRKVREWLGDEKMAQYLRPATLFNRTKFAQYVGELVTDPTPENA